MKVISFFSFRILPLSPLPLLGNHLYLPVCMGRSKHFYFKILPLFSPLQAKAFELSYLEKVPEVKDTVHKQSLLHHVCTMVVEKFPDSTDLYSEIGAITRSAKVCLVGKYIYMYMYMFFKTHFKVKYLLFYFIAFCSSIITTLFMLLDLFCHSH